MTGSKGGTPPVLFVERADIRDAVRSELKDLGAGVAQVPTSIEQCVEQLISNPSSLLVLDWALGSESVNQVLESARGHFKVETRPIFLIIPEVNPNILATAAEYGVSHVHSGPLSRVGIRDSIKALMHEDESTRQIREVLTRVAAYREKGEWAMATPILRNLLGGNPDNDRVVLELAENLIHEDGWDEAMGLLQPLAHSDPPRIRALQLLGRYHLQRREFDLAIGMLSKAKIINPHNVDRLLALGEAFLNVNEVTKAKENFQEALELDQDNEGARSGASTAMLLSGEVNEALELIKALSGPREKASVFNTAAVLAMHQTQYAKGMELYRTALKALGSEPTVAARLFFNMGIGYKRQGDNAKAVACFDKSISLDPAYTKAQQFRTALAKAPGAKQEQPDLFDMTEFSLVIPKRKDGKGESDE